MDHKMQQMKRLTIILTTATMLTGCAVTSPETETAENSTSATETAVTVTEAETSTETTAAETTTTAAAVNETDDEPTTISEEYEDELHTSHIENVPQEEQAALDKLRAKYGKDFTFICRDVQWEFINKPIPEKKPTYYTLEDEEGRRFFAYGTEDSDEISGDNYASPLFEDELYEHARDYIRSYTQAGKLYILSVSNATMPFEAPAELTYDEFFSYFCKQEGKIFADILLPEGTELPEELTVFDNMNSIYLDDFGCQIVLGVYYLPQKDYDRLDDVMYGDIYINRDHMKGANE